MRLAMLMALSLASGCGAAFVLHRDVPRPAEIPARAFPVVYVAAADDTSREAATAIADHLAEGPTRVVRVAAPDLITRAASEPSATLALLVTVRVFETIRTEMSQLPTTRCDPGTPCYGYSERFPVDVRVQVGDLLVRALDPRTGVELGHAALHDEERNPSQISGRLAILERLRDAAVTFVDVRVDTLDLELDGCSDEIARAALDDARNGAVHIAREALRARGEDTSLAVAERAAIMFDLGQLVRVDVDTTAADPIAEETARLAAAETYLLAAIRLAPTDRHERALTQLRAERQARQDVRAQDAAAALNFATTP